MTTTTDAAANWNAHVLAPDGDRSRDSGRAAIYASARQSRGKAELTCRFAGSHKIDICQRPLLVPALQPKAARTEVGKQSLSARQAESTSRHRLDGREIE